MLKVKLQLNDKAFQEGKIRKLPSHWLLVGSPNISVIISSKEKMFESAQPHYRTNQEKMKGCFA